MSRDLISRSYLLSQYELKDATKYRNETAEQQRNSYDTLMKYEIADMIEDAPTAFDLESVMRQLEENKQDLFNAIDKNYQNNAKESVNALKGLFEDYTEEVLIILESAANATDEKNGG